MNHDIIKLLDLKDSDLIIDGPVIKKNKKILTVTKKLEPVFCPVCGSRMHSKGIYTRTVNHPVLQDGYQLILELKQWRWRCTYPLCDNILNDSFSFVQPNKRNTNITDISIVMAFKDLHLSAAQIAERFSVSDTYAINTFARHVDMPRRQLPEIISIDEVHVNVSKVCNYALVIQDFKTGEPVDMIANRRQEITEPYFQNIPFSERKQVKYLISDMYRPYLGYVDKYFPIANSFLMVQRHCAGNAHISRLSNGPMESLNRLVKDLKRNGHGYHNFEHLRNRFLFSQRENASILATPKPLEEVCPKTGKQRGPYKKKEQ